MQPGIFFQSSHGPYGLGATRLDFLQQVFLLIKFHSEQLLLSWSFRQHNQRGSPQWLDQEQGGQCL